ncbi:MAG: response regulator transcription factor [Vampirovibrionales bacterium]|nr:response regulator transcription factor [Vampirovibrionales bacterium]
MSTSSQTSAENTSTLPIQLYIVEDYHLTRMGLTSALSEFPRIKFVGEAGSAEEALSDLPNKKVDVLILDLGLPGMNGIEMAQEVKKRWPEMKIVILTSHNQSEEIIAALAAGANAYALKDIKPSRLSQVIETVYEGAAWLDPAIAAVVLNNVVSSADDDSLRASLSPDGPGREDYNLDGSPELTAREKEVLKLIVQGKNNQEISDTLFVSIHTTKAHVSSILAKLCVNDRVQAAVKALKENLV